MALFSFSALAQSSHFDQAIQHAEAAVKSDDGETIANHASMSKKYALHFPCQPVLCEILICKRNWFFSLNCRLPASVEDKPDDRKDATLDSLFYDARQTQ